MSDNFCLTLVGEFRDPRPYYPRNPGRSPCWRSATSSAPSCVSFSTLIKLTDPVFTALQQHQRKLLGVDLGAMNRSQASPTLSSIRFFAATWLCILPYPPFNFFIKSVWFSPGFRTGREVLDSMSKKAKYASPLVGGGATTRHTRGSFPESDLLYTAFLFESMS